MFVSDDGKPLEPGGRVIDIPVTIHAMKLLLRVETPSGCSSLVLPLGGTACSVLALVALLLGLKSLHVFVQNSVLQRWELSQLRELNSQRKQENILDGSEVIQRMIATFITVEASPCLFALLDKLGTQPKLV